MQLLFFYKIKGKTAIVKQAQDWFGAKNTVVMSLIKGVTYLATTLKLLHSGKPVTKLKHAPSLKRSLNCVPPYPTWILSMRNPL